MTWLLQAAVVLAVPVTLGGAVTAGVYLYRRAREGRTGAALTGIDLQLGSMSGTGHFMGWVGDRVDGFKGWLADKVDGVSDSGSSSDGEGWFDGGPDASGGADASDTSSD